MKFLAEECCDVFLVDKLRATGRDVLYVVEEEQGISDSQVLTKAFSENRILITEDKDFANLLIA